MKIFNKHVNIENFFEKVPNGSLLMIDYDGTLAPFVTEREHAYPYPGVKERLSSLLEKKNTRTVIVSGRRLSELEMLLGVPNGLELWGSHGLERKLSNGKEIKGEIDPNLRKGLELGLKACLENTNPINCENKPYAVALHWRGMDQTEQLQLMETIVKDWEKITSDYRLAIHPFDGGLELMPKGQSKGNVVQELLNEMPKDTAVAFLGDDVSDEEAFRTLGNIGLKILVREQSRPTLADIQLVPPQELLDFLDQWIGRAK